MERPPIKSQERDIDNLVVEELYVSNHFRKWFLNQLDEKAEEFKGAWKSLTTNSGETDIAAGFSKTNQKIIILIENKIYAPEQPQQAKRYRKRGKNLIKNKNWDKFKTCLLAPEKYLETMPSEKYDYHLAYEDLLRWFKVQNNRRSEFKEKIIKEGIEKARKGYHRETDENTSQFYEYYEKLAKENYPQLEYEKPKEVASGNNWIIIYPSIFPNGVKIIHKSRDGYLDLQNSNFEGGAKDFMVKYEEILGEEMTVHNTGKSVSVRIIVPEIPNVAKIKEPEKFEGEILESIKAAAKLMNWYINNFH